MYTYALMKLNAYIIEVLYIKLLLIIYKYLIKIFFYSEIGKEKGLHICRVDCSSYFSGKLCARLGFEQIYELNYADYVDEDGNPIFSPAFPHTAIVTYIKKL